MPDKNASFIEKLVKGVSIPFILLIIIDAANALTAHGELIDNFTINKIDDQAITTLSLRTPIRYIGHFPESEGRELKVRFQAILRKPFSKSIRESVSPSVNECPLIKDVTVNPGIGDGYYLTYHFTHTTRYTVRQQSDSQQIVVILQNANADDTGNPCNASE